MDIIRNDVNDFMMKWNENAHGWSWIKIIPKIRLIMAVITLLASCSVFATKFVIISYFLRIAFEIDY